MELIKQIDENIIYENKNVRITGTEDEPWFVAKDICNILDIVDISKALQKIPESWKSSKVINTTGGNQDMRILNESGLYMLIMRSNKPIAQKFQEFVCKEILPSIRKKGEFKLQKMLEEKEQEKLELLEEKTKIEEEKAKLEKKYIRKKNQIVKDGLNVVYLMTSLESEKNREYIVGSAEDLTQRKIQYELNKLHEFKIIYYISCKGLKVARLLESVLLAELSIYKLKAGRDVFLLPEDKDICFFKEIFDYFGNKAINWCDEDIRNPPSIEPKYSRKQKEKEALEHKEKMAERIQSKFSEEIFEEKNKEVTIVDEKKSKVDDDDEFIIIDDEEQDKDKNEVVEETKETISNIEIKYDDEILKRIAELDEKYNFKEIRNMCKELELIQLGNKKNMIERIVMYEMNTKTKEIPENEDDIDIAIVSSPNSFVYQYNNKGNFIAKYKNIRDINIDGIRKSDIQECLDGKITKAGEFIWRYTQTGFSDEELKEINRKNCMIIIKIDTDGKEIERYSSIKETAEKNNIGRGVVDRMVANSEFRNGIGYRILNKENKVAKLTDKQKEELMMDYKNGFTIDELCSKYKRVRKYMKTLVKTLS